MANQTGSDDFPATALPLDEALRKFVPAELWEAYEQAVARRKTLPRRMIAFSAWLNGERTSASDRMVKQTSSAETAVNQARQDILGKLRAELISGQLTGYAREVFPFGPVRPIPADAWRNLRITNLRTGKAKGPGIELTGIRVAEGQPQQNLEAHAEAKPEQSGNDIAPDNGEFTANENYTSVRLGSVEFRFADMQAAVIRELHKASMTPEPWRSGKVLLHAAGSQSHSLSNLFRRKTDPSWRLLIDYRHNGEYRLRLTHTTESR